MCKRVDEVIVDLMIMAQHSLGQEDFKFNDRIQLRSAAESFRRQFVEP